MTAVGAVLSEAFCSGFVVKPEERGISTHIYARQFYLQLVSSFSPMSCRCGVRHVPTLKFVYILAATRGERSDDAHTLNPAPAHCPHSSPQLETIRIHANLYDRTNEYQHHTFIRNLSVNRAWLLALMHAL